MTFPNYPAPLIVNTLPGLLLDSMTNKVFRTLLNQTFVYGDYILLNHVCDVNYPFLHVPLTSISIVYLQCGGQQIRKNHTLDKT